MGVVALLPSSPSYYQLVQLIFHAMTQPWLYPHPVPSLLRSGSCPAPADLLILTQHYPQTQIILKIVQAQEEEAR